MKLSFKKLMSEIAQKYYNELEDESDRFNQPHHITKLNFIKKLINIPQKYRVHLSAQPLSMKDIKDVPQTIKIHGGIGDKPKGLWYSFGGQWARFVYEQYQTAPASYAYILDIDSSEIFVVDNANKAIELENSIKIKNGAADWSKLQKLKYTGIEVLDPYASQWIYEQAWDVPSGVIWSKRALKNIYPVKKIIKLK